MSRRSGVISALGLLVAGSLAVALLGGGGDDRPEPAARDAAPSRSGPVTQAAALGAGGTELLELLTEGRRRTFHARYEGIGPAASSAGGSLVVEVWRKGELSRQDTEVTDGQQRVRTASLARPQGNVSCRRRGDGPWTCALAPRGSSGPDQLVEDVTADLRGRTVTARDDTIRGRTVRCFTIAAPDQQSELCATPDGIPVRIATGDARLDLTELSNDVADQVFEPPA